MAEMMGKTLADFILGLYWIIGILAVSLGVTIISAVVIYFMVVD